MKIEVTQGGNILLKEVFNSVLFETVEGQKIAVCMRDGGFEIGITDLAAKPGAQLHWYRAMDGAIVQLMGDTCQTRTE